MVDENIEYEKYEYPEDVLEFKEGRFVGVRTLILALVALIGYIGAVYAPIFAGVSLDTEGLFNLTAGAFAFFFIKTIIPLVQK